jgi:hypothetical protein
MGVFQEMVPVFNRAPMPLVVTFDGQQTTVPIGASALPIQTVGYAKNQNPIMGSCDPHNPSLSGGQYLIGVIGKDNCEPLDKEEWDAHCNAACRMDWKELVADISLKKGEHYEVRGKGRKVQAKSAFDAGVRVHGNELITE